MTDEWYSLLPKSLLQAAFKADSELAWPKQEALQVVDVLESKGYLISSVQTWLPTNLGPTPLIYDWPLRKISKDKQKSAKDFIITFKDPIYSGPLDPVFNISALKA